MELKYLLYFLVGGIITSAVTYFANHSRGLVAAFIGTLPVITISTFLLIYASVGQAAVISYARGLVIMIIPWLVFILSVIVLSPKIQFVPAMIVGLFLQIIIALVILARFEGIPLKP